jgi:Bacterial Ig-like domain
MVNTGFARPWTNVARISNALGSAAPNSNSGAWFGFKGGNAPLWSGTSRGRHCRRMPGIRREREPDGASQALTGSPYQIRVSVMSLSYKLFAVLLAVAAGIAGCAGNGQGLDASGLPIGSSSGGGGGGGGGGGAVTADFASIQANVFTPICSPCHSGANAPEGLMLDAAHSYNLIVGVPSTERATVDRIKPGDPDNSYLVRKIQGGPDIDGVQMPYMETPLPQSTIDAIRTWVANGALQGSTSSTGSVNAMQRIQALANATPAPFNVTQTSPLNEAVVDAPVSHILVAFNHEVDASLINYTNLILERVNSGMAAALADASTQAVRLPSYSALAAGNPQAIIMTPVAPLPPGTYRVTVRGTGGGAVADLNAQALGTDYFFTFTVDGSP